VGSAVFKTVEAGVPRLAGSIPVRLRYQRFLSIGRDPLVLLACFLAQTLAQF
jgi:hypothetical protein